MHVPLCELKKKKKKSGHFAKTLPAVVNVSELVVWGAYESGNKIKKKICVPVRYKKNKKKNQKIQKYAKRSGPR